MISRSFTSQSFATLRWSTWIKFHDASGRKLTTSEKVHSTFLQLQQHLETLSWNSEAQNEKKHDLMIYCIREDSHCSCIFSAKTFESIAFKTVLLSSKSRLRRLWYSFVGEGEGRRACRGSALGVLACTCGAFVSAWTGLLQNSPFIFSPMGAMGWQSRGSGDSWEPQFSVHPLIWCEGTAVGEGGGSDGVATFISFSSTGAQR